jgi:acyl-CoA synthetase (AMP-forming)/AMP-acid ligase II
MPEIVLDAIRRHARERGGQLAYRTPARNWSFAQFDDASSRVAQGLKSLGIGAGDRVACLTKQTVECAVLVLAANKIGAVCMPVNWRLAPPEIEYIVNNGQAKLMMADAAFVAAAGKIRTFVTEDFSSWYGEFPATDPGYRPDAVETALQLYSSGTTGLPKGVELTHRNLMVGMVEAVPDAIGYNGPPDVMLNVLPTYHIAGIGIALLTASKAG